MRDHITKKQLDSTTRKQIEVLDRVQMRAPKTVEPKPGLECWYLSGGIPYKGVAGSSQLDGWYWMNGIYTDRVAYESRQDVLNESAYAVVKELMEAACVVMGGMYNGNWRMFGDGFPDPDHTMFKDAIVRAEGVFK